MSEPALSRLSRREREILLLIYRMGKATAKQVTAAMVNPPSHSAVRAFLRILENKGHLRHEEDGIRNVYFPSRPVEQVQLSALKSIVTAFFGGSAERVVAALLQQDDARISDEELERISQLVDEAKNKGH